MAEEAAYRGGVSGDLEEGLVSELQCHRRSASSFLFSGEEEYWCPSFFSPEAPSEAAPTTYSGPTIGDVEAALAMSCSGAESGSHVCRRATIALPERGFTKMEGKFSMRIKCCSNGMADDGYKWRKYGQKFIKNNPYPRSYYRCTNPRCSAKKQMERSADDPETLIVTYDGLHLHYAFPHFPLSSPREIAAAAAAPAVKKAKLETDQAAAPQASARRAPPRAAAGEGNFGRAGGSDVDAEACRTLPQRETSTAKSSLEPPAGRQPAELPQGLLQDVVPELVRKPCGNIDYAVTSDPSLASLPSSPPSSSPSSQFSWSHVSSFFDDLDILSMPSSPASTSSSSGTFPWPHGISLFDFGVLPGTA